MASFAGYISSSFRGAEQLQLFMVLLGVSASVTTVLFISAMYSARFEREAVRKKDPSARWWDALQVNAYTVIGLNFLGEIGVFLVPPITYARHLVGRPLPLALPIITVLLGLGLLWLADRQRKLGNNGASRWSRS